MYMAGGGSTRVHGRIPKSYDRWMHPPEIKRPIDLRFVIDVVMWGFCFILGLVEIVVVIMMILSAL